MLCQLPALEIPISLWSQTIPLEQHLPWLSNNHTKLPALPLHQYTAIPPDIKTKRPLYNFTPTKNISHRYICFYDLYKAIWNIYKHSNNSQLPVVEYLQITTSYNSITIIIQPRAYTRGTSRSSTFFLMPSRTDYVFTISVKSKLINKHKTKLDWAWIKYLLARCGFSLIFFLLVAISR